MDSGARPVQPERGRPTTADAASEAEQKRRSRKQRLDSSVDAELDRLRQHPALLYEREYALHSARRRTGRNYPGADLRPFGTPRESKPKPDLPPLEPEPEPELEPELEPDEPEPEPEA